MSLIDETEKAAEKVDAARAAARRPAAAAAAAAAAVSGVEFICADQVVIEPINWLWKGYLAAGKLHIEAGAPGTGKTTIAMSIAAVISTGGYWPDDTRAAVGRVLIWSGEDDPADTLVPRLRAMGADLSQIAFVDGAKEIVNGVPRRVAFDPSKHLIALASRIASDPPALLIIDPIVSAVAGDSHKNAETRRGLQPLVDIARLHGVAVLGITHFSKGTQGRDPTERVTGSLAFGAVARVVFVCSKTHEGSRVFMRSKSNIGSDEGGFEYNLEQVPVRGFPGVFASMVSWGARLEGNAREVLAEAEAEPQMKGKTPDEPNATDEAIEALREVLEPGELVRREVMVTMRAAGFTDKVIRLARERMGVVMRREGSGKDMKSFWSLPESAHSCPADPFVPSTPNSVGGAQMPCEGTNEVDAAIDGEVFL